MIDFPNSPNNGDTHITNNSEYVYDGTKNIWKINTGNVVGITTTNVTEGQNLYYSNARVYANVASTYFFNYPSTTNVSLTYGTTAGRIFRSENSELAIGLEDSSPYPYYIQARTNLNSARDIVINPLGGKLGIGTLSPTYNFDVVGNGNGALVSRLYNQSTGSSAESIFQINAGGRFVNFTANYTGQYIIEGQNGLSTRYFDYTTLILRDSSGNEKVRFNNSTGNVGIGTSSPSYKLEVNGSFAATTKSFVIDHPTKPGMKLRYGSLEGPENGVYVRGKLKDNNVIELPEYWTKLVDPDSITVQLTPIGKHQKLFVEKIEDNKVYVANDGMFTNTVNCFYYVMAERIDVDKLEVEVE